MTYQHDTGTLSLGDLPEEVRAWVNDLYVQRVELYGSVWFRFRAKGFWNDHKMPRWARSIRRMSIAAAKDALLLAVLRAHREGWRP